MHPDFVQQAPLAGDPIEVPDEQQAQQYFRVNRGPTRRAIEAGQPVSHEAEIDRAVDQPEQVGFGNLVLEAEIIERRFLLCLLTHHRGASSLPPPYAQTRRTPREKLFFNSLNFLLNQSSLPQEPLSKAAFRRLSSVTFLTRSACQLLG